MRAVQVTIDEELLRKLDSSDEVQRDGRSAVMRRAVAEYLSRRRHEAVASQYRRAYGDLEGLGDEFEGWEDQGQWPSG